MGDVFVVAVVEGGVELFCGGVDNEVLCCCLMILVAVEVVEVEAVRTGAKTTSFPDDDDVANEGMGGDNDNPEGGKGGENVAATEGEVGDEDGDVENDDAPDDDKLS